MRTRVHLVAATVGLLTILTFWVSTIAAELTGSHDLITSVKQAIPWGLFVLVPALAATGATGAAMAGRSKEPALQVKRRRMVVIAGVGLLILVPSAIYLRDLAVSGDFGAAFVIVQGVELAAGATNLVLMALNACDGLRLTGRLRTPAAAAR
jgi:hypothetical protein